MLSYTALGVNGDTSLRKIQWACLICFVLTTIAVPTMLEKRPNLSYYMLARSNFTAAPIVEFHSQIKSYTLLLLFLLPSTLEHLFAIVFQPIYNKFVAGIGWHRWVSYVVSAPSLVALVIYSIGPGSEIAVTLSIAGLVIVCICMGPIVEYATTNDGDIFLFGMGIMVGFTALFFAFLPVWYYYDRAHIPSDIEPYITAMVSIITALYWSFGFVPIYIYVRRRIEPNIGHKREMIYCTLSLCAKLPLAWLYASMLATRD